MLQRVLCSTKITVEKVEHRCVWERTQLGPSCSYASRDRERTNHTVTRHYIFSYYRLATAIQAASSEESLQLLPGSISACPENTALNRSVAREKKKKKGISHTHFQSKNERWQFYWPRVRVRSSVVLYINKKCRIGAASGKELSAISPEDEEVSQY